MSFEPTSNTVYIPDFEEFQTALGYKAEKDYFPPLLGEPVRQGNKRTQQLRDHITQALDRLEAPFTVRNAYYVMVSYFDYPKTDSFYKKLARELTRLRRLGVIRPDDIIDNSRRVLQYRVDKSLHQSLMRQSSSWNPEIWGDAETVPQIWTEKDTVTGLLAPLSEKYQVPIFVARGFASEGFINQAIRMIYNTGKDARILYVGDHDPSGFYMPTPIMAALRRAQERYDLPEIDYRRLAVLPSQALGELADLSHPPKKDDPRLKIFQSHFGTGAQAVELDAILPQKLREMVAGEIETLLPPDWERYYDQQQQFGAHFIERVAIDGFMSEQVQSMGLLNYIDQHKDADEKQLFETVKKQTREALELDLDDLDFGGFED